MQLKHMKTLLAPQVRILQRIQPGVSREIGHIQVGKICKNSEKSPCHGRGCNDIFQISQRIPFWPDTDSPDSSKENKTKIIKIGLLLMKWWYFPYQ